jgi:hypothetical protein
VKSLLERAMMVKCCGTGDTVPFDGDDDPVSTQLAAVVDERLFREAMAQGSPGLANGTAYLVWRTGRDEAVEAVLRRFDEKVGNALPYDLTVFEAFKTSEDARARLRAAAPSSAVSFVPMDPVLQLPPSALPYEVLRASVGFMVGDAMRMLGSRYEWALHLQDDALLDSVGGRGEAAGLVPDPFRALMAARAQLGYTSSRTTLNAGLWEQGRRFVKTHTLSDTALGQTWLSPKTLDGRWLAFKTRCVRVMHALVACHCLSLSFHARPQRLHVAGVRPAAVVAGAGLVGPGPGEPAAGRGQHPGAGGALHAAPARVLQVPGRELRAADGRVAPGDPGRGHPAALGGQVGRRDAGHQRGQGPAAPRRRQEGGLAGRGRGYQLRLPPREARGPGR